MQENESSTAQLDTCQVCGEYFRRVPQMKDDCTYDDSEKFETGRRGVKAHQSMANIVGTAHAANRGTGLSHVHRGQSAAGHHCRYVTRRHERPNHTDKVKGWKYTVSTQQLSAAQDLIIFQPSTHTCYWPWLDYPYKLCQW